MGIKRPFVEEPFIPKKRNNPPEVPDQGFPVQQSVGDTMGHVMVAKAPMTEIDIVEKDIVDDTKNTDPGGSKPAG